jgi:hypothetical protein
LAAHGPTVSWKFPPTPHIEVRDSVRSCPCLRAVGRLEDSTIPSGMRMSPEQTAATRPRIHPIRTRFPIRTVEAATPKSDSRATADIKGGLPTNSHRGEAHKPPAAPNTGRVRRVAGARSATGARRATGAGARWTARDRRAVLVPMPASTSRDGSWSKIREPPGPTNESARSKGGSRATTASPSPAPSDR